VTSEAPDRTNRGGTPPNVRIVGGPAFELIAELAAFTSGPARASLESGKPWIRDVRRLAGGGLLNRVERYVLPIYIQLSTIALETTEPRGVDELLGALEAMEGHALRRRLLGADSRMNRAMAPNGAFDRALEGDPAAVADVHAALETDRSTRPAVVRVLTLEPNVLRAEILAIVGDWAERVFSQLSTDALAAIDRDVAAKRTMLATQSGQAVLEAATSGVTFKPSAWVEEIAIVPTIALRPFVAPTELESTAIFVCPVAEEALDIDPLAPPRRLVRVAAALGDPLRLRVLHALGGEELTASEIAERLGVDRTSLHHHLGILRSAGLLTIRDEGELGWRYALRDDGLEGLAPDLEAYLRRKEPT
jgi:DNA-binding transcriptional ArsR family regulator